jgi:predicted RNase H-like HicB family nuclease
VEFAVLLAPDADAGFRASVPELPVCVVAGANLSTVLPQLRLAVESELTRRLLAGEALPPARDEGDQRSSHLPTGGQWLTVHINVAHLEAVATHQRGR